MATTHVPAAEAKRFGIMRLGEDGRIRGFEEKPKHDTPWRTPTNPGACSASMGNLFSTDVLLEALHEDALDASSSHDFARDILPKLINTRKVFSFDFIDETRKEVLYWRDVGTLDAYYDANMDLIEVTPIFNLYDQKWPLRCALTGYPPAKFVFSQEGRLMGIAPDSPIPHGCINSGGRITRSVLSPGVRIESHCAIEDSILFAAVQIGHNCRIRRVIIDQSLCLPENTVIGFDPASDREAGYKVSSADNGSKALEIFSGGRRHAVVTDLDMPGLSGIEVSPFLANDTEATGAQARQLWARAGALTSICLEGLRSRPGEFMTLLRVMRDFVRGFRVLHPAGPCVTVFC